MQLLESTAEPNAVADSAPSVPLAKGQGVRFSCVGCAGCCGHWTIHQERWKADELQQRDWVIERLKHYGLKLRRVDRQTVQLPLKDDEYCVFLDEDRRCLIELHEGRRLKPDDCKRFPFAVGVRVDGFIVTDASAYCKSISERYSLEFLPVIPDDDTTSLASEDHIPLPERVRVRGCRHWGRVEYDRFLTALHELFKHNASQPWQALKQLQGRLAGRDLGDPVPRTPALDGPRPAAERWLTWLFLRKPFGYYGLWRLLVHNELTDRAMLPRPVRLRAVESVTWPAGVNPWLAAYAHNVMQRQLLFAKGTAYSLNHLLSLACVGSLLVRFYAKAFAWLDSRPLVEPADVTQAVRLVERYYTGHRPLFLSMIRNLPGGGVLHRLVL